MPYTQATATPPSPQPVQTAPVSTPTPPSNNEGPDAGILWGFNFSGSVPSYYTTAGMDEVVFLVDGTRATYNYMGQGQMAGGGANLSVYGGLVFNVDGPEDYTGLTQSCGITLSVAQYGVSIDYFWSGDVNPFTPGVPKGFTIGWTPGIAAGGFCVTADYQNTWSFP